VGRSLKRVVFVAFRIRTAREVIAFLGDSVNDLLPEAGEDCPADEHPDKAIIIYFLI
jgi:hypothetical protein